MITDENAMFDVLGDFFYHVNTKVRVAALEVSDFHVKNNSNCLFTFENSFLSLGLRKTCLSVLWYRRTYARANRRRYIGHYVQVSITRGPSKQVNWFDGKIQINNPEFWRENSNCLKKIELVHTITSHIQDRILPRFFYYSLTAIAMCLITPHSYTCKWFHIIKIFYKQLVFVYIFSLKK